ncbi:unnamed protein product [Bubo scandiacus]
MRAAAGSVPAALPELGPKSSPALRCLFPAAPISAASTLSIGDRGEEGEEAEEEEVGKEEGARGWQPQLALMSTNVFKVQRGISSQANRPRRPPPGPAGGPVKQGSTAHDIKSLRKMKLGLMAHGFCSKTPEIN